MNTHDLTMAIKHLAPESEFSFTDDDLSTLKWDTPNIPQPSIDEILAAIPIVQKIETKKLKDQQSAKAALLERLGITADEATLLLS